MRHLLAAYDLNRDRLYGHVKKHKGRTEFRGFWRYLPSLYPPEVRIAIVSDNFSPHLSTRKDQRVGEWAGANNVELGELAVAFGDGEGVGPRAVHPREVGDGLDRHGSPVLTRVAWSWRASRPRAGRLVDRERRLTLPSGR